MAGFKDIIGHEQIIYRTRSGWIKYPMRTSSMDRTNPEK